MSAMPLSAVWLPWRHASPWGPGAQRRRAIMVLLGGLVATNVTMLACAVASWFLGGSRGVASAMVAAAVVILFFGLAQGVQVMVAEMSPVTILVASMGSFAIRVAGLGALLRPVMAYRDRGYVDLPSLMLTLLVCTTTWIGAEMLTVKNLRIPVYDTEYQPPCAEEGGL